MLDGYVVEYDSGPTFDQYPVEKKVTEDLLKKGGAVVTTMNGSFACAVVDMNSFRLSVWTDRIASRPVWITRSDKTWLVGNYPAALAALMPTAPRLNAAGLWSLFLSSRHVGQNGLYDGFRNLQGGCCANIDFGVHPGRIQISRWCENVYRPEIGIEPGEWGEAVAAELKAAANRLQGHSDSPQLFLSGGLDSRLILGAIGNSATGVTLTSTPNNMNVRLARRAAHIVGARHVAINRSPNWYLDRFELASLLAGGNYNLAHAHFLIPVDTLQKDKPSMTFLLGDLMENFNKHYFKWDPTQDIRFIPEEIPSVYPQLYSYTHGDEKRLRRLFQDGVADHLSTAWSEAVVELCREVETVSDDAADCLDTLFRWYNCSLCPTYLMSECIRPFGRERNLMFDTNMIELLHRIPAKVRGAGVLHPWTLWHLNKGLALLPDSNSWVPPISPKSLKTFTRSVRPTIGRLRRRFRSMSDAVEGRTATEGSWHMLETRFREDPEHRVFLESVIEDKDCFPSDIFRRDQVQSAWQAFIHDRTSRDRAFEINMLLSFGLLNRRIPTSGLA